QPWPPGFDGRGKDRIDLAPANFLDVAHGLLFDGSQAATDVALGGLRAHQIHALALDEIGVVIENASKILSDLVADATRFDDVLAAGQFAGLAKQKRGATFQDALEAAAHGGPRRQARGGVALA